MIVKNLIIFWGYLSLIVFFAKLLTKHPTIQKWKVDYTILLYSLIVGWFMLYGIGRLGVPLDITMGAYVVVFSITELYHPVISYQ